MRDEKEGAGKVYVTNGCAHVLTTKESRGGFLRQAHKSRSKATSRTATIVEEQMH
jgi:hypothetical protein